MEGLLIAGLIIYFDVIIMMGFWNAKDGEWPNNDKSLW